MVSVAMVLFIGRIGAGVLCLIPNILPVAMALGAMGWLGFELTIYTMMMGSIAIGLAVDDTIHITHQFFRNLPTMGAEEAVEKTLETTGRALLTTTVVLALGFSVFGFGEMPTLRELGLTTALAIALAFISDVLILPALLTLIGKR